MQATKPLSLSKDKKDLVLAVRSLLGGDPARAAQAMFGIPSTYLWWGAQNIIRSVFENKRVAVKSGHSLSKDWSAAIIAILWLMKYPGVSKVVCTAPKMEQVKLIMFGEIKKQYEAMKERFPFPIAGHKEPMRTTMLRLGPEWYAFGMTTKETGQRSGKFQGFKSPNILIILSEAQDIEDNIFDQMAGMTTSGNARILEIGNPISEEGRFWEHCTQAKYGYKVMTMSCFDSPNVVAGREIIPGVVTKEWIEEKRSIWGEGHPYWTSRVLGQFPAFSKDSVIPISWVMRARRDQKFLKTEDPEDNLKVGGLDVSNGGLDETAHVVLTGKKLSRLDAFHNVEIAATVGWAKQICWEENLVALGIDEGGMAGVASFMEEDHRIHAAIMRIFFGSTLEDDDDFANLAAAMWWELRVAFEKQEIFIPDDPILIAQLSQRKWEFTSKGVKKIKLESKQLLRSSGTDSPDRGDALAMAWWVRRCFKGSAGISPKFESESSMLENGKNKQTGAQPMYSAKRILLNESSQIDD